MTLFDNSLAFPSTNLSLPFSLSNYLYIYIKESLFKKGNQNKNKTKPKEVSTLYITVLT